MTAITLSSRACRYASSRFRLDDETFTTPDGEVTRPVIHHPGAVAIIAQPTPDSLLLVRQYRYPVRRWTLEIPAGTRVPGEAALATAMRELREEAGFSASQWSEALRFFPALGVSDEELIIFRARHLSEVPAAPEHGELVSREVVPVDALPGLMRDGQICDAKTMLAMTMLGQPMQERAA